MDVYGIIGNPVGHTLSPAMHEAAFDHLDIDAKYVAFEPDPDSALEAIESAETLGVKGLNVTIPFKQDVLAAVEPDDLAARIGAVNTVDFSTQPPTGYNTDAHGIIRSLEYHDVPLAGTAVVVGAGGAGRAVAFALADQGFVVHIANRTVENAVDLAAAVNEARHKRANANIGEKFTAHGLDDLSDLLAEADLLINATSVGMEADRSPVESESLHADLVVFDAVYSPIDTSLLREAEEAGAKTIDGAWMLLFQGVAAFERWTGQDAPVDVMNRALRAGLE